MPFQLGRRTLASAIARAGGVRDRATGERNVPRVAIVGAGLSGIGMAVQLRRAGHHDFVLFEKAETPGGTWRDNTYPGSGCDVPSHLYSFSFAPKSDWSRRFAGQPEILGYVEALVCANGIRPHIRFGTEVTAMRFDEENDLWILETDVGERFEAEVVIAACGQLNRPHVPDLPGLESFRGPAFHSARWDHSVDLAGRDVVVVGNGASAVQFVPELSSAARSVTVFQRSANYVAPKADRTYSRLVRFVLRNVRAIEVLYRWSIYWRLEMRFFAFRRGAPVAKHVEKRFSTAVRETLVGDRLSEEALVPGYPIGCKRILLSSDWYPTLLQPHVRVETSEVVRFEPDGVVSADGAHHRADAVVFGTGFESLDFLAPIDVEGAEGAKLADVWREGAEANLGITVAGFPNLFILYGPNTNLGHNSILFMVERQIDYVLQCLAGMVRRDIATLEVRRDRMDAFNRRVEEAMTRTAWAGACHSWYKTATGRVTNNWPGFTVSYWLDTLWPRPRDFSIVERREQRTEHRDSAASTVRR